MPFKLTGCRPIPQCTVSFSSSMMSMSVQFVLFSFEEVDSFPVEEIEIARDPVTLEETAAFLSALELDVINSPVRLVPSENGLDVADGVEWELALQLEPNPFFGDLGNGEAAIDGTKSFLSGIGSVTLETHQASFSTPMESTQTTLSDGYEVAVPVDKMADCFQGVIDLVSSDASHGGLFNDITLRFVGKEDGQQSVSGDKPQMWMSFQDHLYYNND